MARCTHCNTPIPKSQILKSCSLAYRDIKCSKCGAVYEHTFSNKVLIASEIALSLAVAFLISNYLNLEGIITYLIAATLAVLSTYLTAPWLEFKKVKAAN